MKFCDGGWDKISSERIREIVVVLEQNFVKTWLRIGSFMLGSYPVSPRRHVECHSEPERRSAFLNGLLYAQSIAE
jgi:hypothetical protein